MSKLETLKKLRNELDIQINGKDNYPKDVPCVIITNHNRLLDIFYTPLAFDNDIVSLISARLVYKQDLSRLEVVNKYLNAFPIEAHGGNKYSNMCLDYASKILDNKINLSICPEGAYLEGKDYVYKGRTGAIRILFKSLDNNNFSYLLPVSIDIETNKELDCYNVGKDKVKIEILNPIDPINYYKDFNDSYEKEKNVILHKMIKEGMQNISKSLNREYLDEYIELYPKGNVIFNEGITIPKEEAQDKIYIEKYNNDLNKLSLKLINDCGGNK